MSVYNFNGDPVTEDSGIITGELPIVFIKSSTEYADVTKTTTSKGTLTFVDGIAKMEDIPIKFKLQGSGSLAYNKHNFNITFYNDLGKKRKFQFNNWYPTNKIHMKANEFDYSMVRNSVGTTFTYRMMGKYLPQGARGYIDSFPVILYYNGEYMGCYTWNLPQDGKTYNFTDEQEEACTNLAYRCGTTSAWATNSNWEYRGSVDETDDMRTAFTTLHNIMVDYKNLTTSIVDAHFDVDTLIGYWVLADIMLAVDSLVNNWTLVTWDGTIWYHTWYDLDLIFGLGGDDGYNLSATKDITTCQQYRYNGFWAKIIELYPDKITAMYATMRRNGVDADSIYEMFHAFQSTWGWQNIEKDREIWADDKRNHNEISRTWIANRITYLDGKYSYSE